MSQRKPHSGSSAISTSPIRLLVVGSHPGNSTPVSPCRRGADRGDLRWSAAAPSPASRSTWAVEVIPLYLVGRGLQLLVRLERAGVRDGELYRLQRRRLRWLAEHGHRLEGAVASALVPERDARRPSG
jgi:hypothetical protein